MRAWAIRHADRNLIGCLPLADCRPPILRPVDELVAALGSDHPIECWFAVVDLGFHGDAAAIAVPALCKMGTNHNYFWGNGDGHTLEEQIVRVLVGLGPLATDAIGRLYHWLDHTY